MGSTTESLAFLHKCPIERLSTFFHQVVDGLCGHTQPRFQDYSKVWSVEEWFTVVDRSQKIFKSAVKSHTSAEQFTTHIDSLPPEYQKVLTDCYNVRRDEIRRTLLEDTAAISQAQFKDFDWKLKLAMSSDKLASVHEPLLTLDLDLQEEQGKKTVSVELNQEELKKMVTTLEAANKAVLQLKS
ncbi:COMM domain-containing protein 8-like [Ptychodera flava]|uniref:COMM domain-containing protein 8-like n=1 Tax=Ptychodera flava TaxID=63121 RepID=UPI00396A2858